MTSRRTASAVASLTLVASTDAYAHTGAAGPGGFGRGVAHPFAGFDHLIAMIAVGVWAARRGGRSVWFVPVAFLLLMTIGAILGAIGIAVPFAGAAVVLSLFVFAMIVVAAVKLPMWASLAIVAGFALLYGDMHGTAMAPNAAALSYGAGFLLATALLHATGVGLVALTRRLIMAARRMMY